MGRAFGNFEPDTRMFELRLWNLRMPMEPKAFDVWAYLVLYRVHLVSKEGLMDQIGGGRFVTESAVTSRFKQCRRAVGVRRRVDRSEAISEEGRNLATDEWGLARDVSVVVIGLGSQVWQCSMTSSTSTSRSAASPPGLPECWVLVRGCNPFLGSECLTAPSGCTGRV